jgi:lysophospholipase L1-like esterase
MRPFRFMALIFSLATCLAFGQTQNESGIKRIMVFGDSNTWGFQPSITNRYAPDVRWPGVLGKALGGGYEIIEEGLTCRTVDITDRTCGFGGVATNGEGYLPPAIVSHAPLDLVVVMLGTNDTRKDYGHTTQMIADGLMRLANIVRRTTDVYGNYPAPKVLIVSPVPFGTFSPVMAQFFDAASVDKSKQLAGVVGPMAAAARYPFFDAATVLSTADGDGVHLSAAAHAKLGNALVAPVLNALK